MSFHSRAALGAIDQALVAAAHFLLGILIARMGGVVALGEFAFAYVAIVMANMLYGAIIGEIYSIDPSVAEGEEQLGAGFILLPSLAMAILFVGLSQLLRLWGQLGRAVGTAPFIVTVFSCMCFLASKVYFYRNAKQITAIIYSLVYASIMLGSTYIEYRTFHSVASPFLGMAVGASSCALLFLTQVRWCRPNFAAVNKFLLAAYHYAKWAVPATALIWLANNGYFLLMPSNKGLEDAAGLRAILNLMMPFNTLLVGASAALLPMLAEYRKEHGVVSLGYFTHKLALTISVGAAVFALAAAFISPQLVVLAYGEKFGKFAPALRVAVFLPCLWGVAVIYRTSIRALGQSFDLFKVYFFALFPVGVFLMVWLSRYGISESLIGIISTQVLVALGFIYRFLKITQSERYEGKSRVPELVED